MYSDSDDEISDFSGDESEIIDDSSDNEACKTDFQTKNVSGQKGQRHFDELRSTLALDQFKDKAELKRDKRRRQKEKRKLKKLAEQGTKDGLVKVETLATKLSASAAKVVPEVVVYSDPRKRPKANSDSPVNSKKESKPQLDADTLTMKQARFDVFKFGIRGLDKEGQHEARVALALRLGAKPEKRKCLPYDKYKEEARVRKEEVAKQKELARVTGMQRVSARPLSAKKKSKIEAKSSSDSGKKRKKKPRQNEGIPLKVGKFDGGTLRLSKKDLSSLKK